MNADDSTSVGRYGDSDERYSGGGLWTRAFCLWRVASRGAFRWREVTLQQGAALFLLRLVVDGNNETQQKEPGATAPEICLDGCCSSSGSNLLLLLLLVQLSRAGLCRAY
jgi:hypothetical protein